MKRVSSTLFIGRDGAPRVSRGYTEIGGIRFEDDIIVYDQNGHPKESRGSVTVPSTGMSEVKLDTTARCDYVATINTTKEQPT